jgi:hypothetical protein
VFIYNSHGKWAFPSLLWSFLPTTNFTSFPAPGCWEFAAAPAFSGRLVYLQFHEGLPLSASSALRAPRPLCYVSFFFCFAYYPVFFPFFPGRVSVCPRGYADLAQGCLWEYHMLFSSPGGLHLPKWSGSWCLMAARELSWFLHLTWSGDAMRGLGVWRSQRFASSWWFFL